MKKDDLLEITIEDISSDGSGVGKTDGFALFVKDTIPGDQVKVKIMKMKKRYGYARLMEILVPSPDRIQAPCPVARQCGGCQIQQMSYERQLAFKENKVCNNLKRLGGLDLSALKVESICGMEEPLHYRNKAQFPIGRDKNGKIIAGFYAGRTHSIIANTDCLLGAEENEAILNEVISWMEACKVEPYDEKTGKGLVRHVLIRKGFTTKELMVCLVINGKKIPQAEKLAAGLQKIDGMTTIMANVNTEQTNVILGKEILPIWGQDYIEDYIGNVKYRISPLLVWKTASLVSAPILACISIVFWAVWNCCNNDIASPNSPVTCEVSTDITAGAVSCCFCATQYWITVFACSTSEASTPGFV